AFHQYGRAACKAAEPELRPLQVDEDADRSALFRLDGADRRHQLAHPVMRGVTHVDAEDVDSRLEKPRDGGAVGGSRSECRDDLGAALTSHLVFPAGAPGCSLDSVSCTVQERCSVVSTSKKPVRSKPRARQLSLPRIVNSLSRVHMNACPDHSPPRS